MTALIRRAHERRRGPIFRCLEELDLKRSVEEFERTVEDGEGIDFFGGYVFDFEWVGHRSNGGGGGGGGGGLGHVVGRL
jgi:hypothetical protein